MSHQVGFVCPGTGPEVLGWDGLSAMVGPVGVVWAHSHALVEPHLGAKSHRSARWGGLRTCPAATFGALTAWGPWWSEGTSETSPRQGSRAHFMSTRAGVVPEAAPWVLAWRRGTATIWGQRAPRGGAGHGPMSPALRMSCFLLADEPPRPGNGAADRESTCT